MSRIRQSLGLAVLDSYAGMALQVLSTVVLARILSPEQTGAFAVAAVFASLASTFRDFGVAEYLIQERNLGEDHIRAALTVNIAASWLMAALLAGSAVWVGNYYGSSVVADVILVQSLNFVLIPFGAVTQAWFRRELQYQPIVVASLSANVVSVSVSISLALAGLGPMALAWGSLAGVAATVAITTLMRPPGFPSWPGYRGLGAVLHFGKFASVVYMVAQVGKGAPELVVGRVAGLADAGMFSRARGLVEMFTRLAVRPTMQVCLPYFAKAERERGSIADAYLRSVSFLTAVGWPALGLMILIAYAAVRLVYGDQWLEAVPAAQVLCLACCVELPFMLSREALLARGEVRRASALQVQLVALQLAGLTLVMPYGLFGASVGLLLSAIAGFFIALWHLRRAIDLRLSALLLSCRASLLLTAFSLAPLGAMTWLAPVAPDNYIFYAFIGAPGVLVLWLLGLRLTGHALWNEVERGFAGLRKRLGRA